VCHKCVFLIDEVGLNELRVRMLTFAEFVPSPKMSRPSAMPVRAIVQAGSARLDSCGRSVGLKHSGSTSKPSSRPEGLVSWGLTGT